MKYCCALLAVKDIHRARKFYEELFGLKVESDYGINVAFSCGLALQQEFGWLVGIDEEKVLTHSNNAELCFEEDSFDEFLQKIKARADIRLLGDVIQHSWGQRVVRFYDGDGHLIEVGESLKKVVERFIAEGMSMEQMTKKMDVTEADIQRILSEK